MKGKWNIEGIVVKGVVKCVYEIFVYNVYSIWWKNNGRIEYGEKMLKS